LADRPDQSIQTRNKDLTKEVQTISYDELVCFHLSPGDVFYSFGSGKRRKILSAGESVHYSLVPNFYKKGINEFLIDYKINSNNVELLTTIFQNYLNSENEEQRLKFRSEYLSWYSSCFWKGIAKGSQLDLIQSLNNVFLFLPESMINELQEHDLETYYRSFKVGAHLFSLALLFGHTDPEYLKELYNVSLLFEYGLHSNGASYHSLKARDMERLNPGKGLEYLIDKKRSELEIESFHQHPSIGKKNLEPFLEKSFKFFELGNLISLHKEASNGKGLPHGLKEENLQVIECLTILCERMTPFDQNSLGIEEEKPLLKTYINQLNEDNNYLYSPVKRLIKRLYELLTEMKEAV